LHKAPDGHKVKAAITAAPLHQTQTREVTHTINMLLDKLTNPCFRPTSQLSSDTSNFPRYIGGWNSSFVIWCSIGELDDGLNSMLFTLQPSSLQYTERKTIVQVPQSIRPGWETEPLEHLGISSKGQTNLSIITR
jgi:hypothetical protein